MIKLLKIKNYKSSFLHDKIETSIELLEWFDVDDVDDKDYCDDCRDIWNWTETNFSFLCSTPGQEEPHRDCDRQDSS